MPFTRSEPIRDRAAARTPAPPPASSVGIRRGLITLTVLTSRRDARPKMPRRPQQDSRRARRAPLWRSRKCDCAQVVNNAETRPVPMSHTARGNAQRSGPSDRWRLGCHAVVHWPEKSMTPTLLYATRAITSRAGAGAPCLVPVTHTCPMQASDTSSPHNL